MSTKKEPEAPGAALDPTMTAMIEAFSKSIQAIAPPKVIKEGDPEFVARLTAEGFYDTFEVPVYQNAYEANPRGLSAEVRARASHLKEGKYLKGRVTVEVDSAGVHLKYPIKGDAMMVNQSLWRDFPDLVNQLWEEQEERAALTTA